MDTKALRQKILDLAIRGKLVPQDPNDEPASVLLERIHAEKQQMVKDGKLKAKDIKNDTVIFKGDDNLHYEQFHDGTVKCIEDEIPFELPEGWAWTRLDNLSCLIQYGLSNSAEGQGSHRLLRITDIQDGKVNWADVPFTTVDNAEKYLLRKNDIVFARTGATVGKSFFITELPYECVYASYLIRIRLFECISSSYLYQFFNSHCYWEQITDKSVGVGQPNCNGTSLKKLFIPLPPLNEQKRIFPAANSLLEYAAVIESEKASMQEIINLTKSKILDLAIRGKLVPQDPNDEPASVLLERIRAEKEELIKQGKIKRNKKESVIFKGDDNSYYEDLPVNWSVSSLSEITTNLILNDGDWILSDNMVPSGEIKLIQLGSVGFLEYVNKGFKYLTPEIFNELGCTEIHSGYMLINRIVSNKMCACILPKIEGKKITTVDTCWIAPKDDWYNLKYILYAISSPLFQSFVMINSSGTTRKRISKSILVSLPLAFPPLAEQKRIVEAIEVAFTKLDEITNSIL